ncbi:hypothetical protein [Candidatus Borrarchaeum sp.]|uniref:hypothetical protein n=1 Tax=Candidatus Borrarchaeum sp. TaxID=2846742 RepID=UPI002579F568|nr:hypothetical protein [Candidatus Borrarchaeum sp.]
MEKRPIGITLLAILVYIVGIIVLVRGLIFLGVIAVTLLTTPLWGVGNELILGIGWIFLALIMMAVGSGLWYMKKWSWFATTVLAVIGLIISALGLTATWLTFGSFLVLTIYLLYALKYFWKTQ